MPAAGNVNGGFVLITGYGLTAALVSAVSERLLRAFTSRMSPGTGGMRGDSRWDVPFWKIYNRLCRDRRNAETHDISDRSPRSSDES